MTDTLDPSRRDLVNRARPQDGADQGLFNGNARKRETASSVLSCTLGRETDPSAVLSSLFETHEPGWRLTVIEPAVGRGLQRHVRGPAGTFTADSLSTLLFQHGFVDTRLETKRGMIVAKTTRGEAPPPSARPLRLSVIMPVYNERETFRSVFKELLAKTIPNTEIEIVVVESNSTDGTRDEVLAMAEDPRVTVILEDEAQGKGHAVRAGLEKVTGDAILIQDADSEYDMNDYEKLLEPLRSFSASFVLGARRCHDGRRGMRHFEEEQHMSRLMNFGHVAFLGLFNLVYGQRLKDPFTMYKVFRRDCLTGINLECDRFDFDWELTAKLIRRGHHPDEIPVWYHSRSFTEGKKIKLLSDPISWVRACFKYRFTPLYRSDDPLDVGTQDDQIDVGRLA
jgi:glycosyltransferase involved in cell wall biosynthesis